MSSGSKADSTASSDSTSKKIKYILITNGDSYVGRTLAMYISDQLMKKEGLLSKTHWRVRVLCEDKSTMKDLEKRGIEVREVDYESEAMLREQMKDRIKSVIFNPFTSNERLIQRGKHLIDAAVHQRIKRILMISAIGCSMNMDKETPMGQFNELENYLRDSYKYGAWVVIRLPLIQQLLHFWSSMIDNKSVIGLPMTTDTYLTTIDIGDVCDCVAQAALSKKSSIWTYQEETNDEDDSDYDIREPSYKSPPPPTAIKRVYELTTTVPMTLDLIAKTLSDAVKADGFDSDIEYAALNDDEVRSYLRFVAGSNKSDIEAHLSTAFPNKKSNPKKQEDGLIFSTLKAFKALFITDLDEFKATHDQDDPNWYPSPKILTPFGIEYIIAHFQNARNSAVHIVPSLDVREITGHEPTELAFFFMKNRRQFRPQ